MIAQGHPFDTTQAIIMFVVLLVSLTAHEAAHALAAKLGGDDTAYRGGQVSLNPLPHIQREPFGMVLLPALSIWISSATMCFGYASTPIDPIWAYHHPKRAAVMSAAGPVANVLLAAIAFAVLWFIGQPESDMAYTVRRIAAWFFKLNVLLAVFNLFPIPPLDGAGVVSGLFRPARAFYENLARLSYFGIVAFVAMIKLMPYVFWPVFNAISRLLPYPVR